MKHYIVLILFLAFLSLVSFVLVGCSTLDEHQRNAIGVLENHRIGVDIRDYCEENLRLMDKHVELGKANISAAESRLAVTAALSEAKQNIDSVSQDLLSGHFTFSVFMEDTTIAVGQEFFMVNVQLMNVSEIGVEVSWNHGFLPHIPGYIDFFDPHGPNIFEIPYPQSVFLEPGGILGNLSIWGDEVSGGLYISNTMSPGEHELRFSFLVPRVDSLILGPRRIWTNTIILTVQ